MNKIFLFLLGTAVSRRDGLREEQQVTKSPRDGYSSASAPLTLAARTDAFQQALREQ